MIKLIKIDGKDNFFIDKISEQKLEKYDPDNPNLFLCVKMPDNSKLYIESFKIAANYGGQISFDYGDDKYIIDDGYQDILIRAGYIVMNEYDVNHEYNQEAGLKIRENIFLDLDEALSKMYSNGKLSYEPAGVPMIKFESLGFKFTIYFDTISRIVNKNQQRKINKLPFYPFDKSMDKYGTIFVSVFCQRVDKSANNNDKYRIADELIGDIIKEMNNGNDSDLYHFNMSLIRKRIVNWNGI